MGSTQQVQDILTALTELGPVTPEQRSELRAAVASVPLIRYEPLRPFGPREQTPAWIGTDEVAHLLRVTPATARKHMCSGVFGNVQKINGAGWRVRKSAVWAWLKANGAA
jgi:hypothetical protein